MMRVSKLFISLTAFTMLASCASKEEPATQAVAQTEAALAEVRGDGSKYAPDALEAAEKDLAAIKEKLAKEDYKAVLANLPALNNQVSALKENVVAKQTQVAAATHEWEALNEEVPKTIQAIEFRVDNLSGSRLPKEVKKESFEAAKASLESMKATWAEATAAFDAGNATEAADKGRIVQAKGAEVFAQLGMSPV